MKANKNTLMLGFFVAFMLSFSMVNADNLAWDNPATLIPFTFGNEYRGIMIAVNTTFTLTNISSQGDLDFRNCYLYDSVENLLNSSAFDAENCTLNYPIEAGNSYYILTDGNLSVLGEANKDHAYWSASFPYESENFSVVAGTLNTGGTFSNQTDPDQGFDIDLIYGEEGEAPELIPTFTEFWLNGTQYTNPEEPYLVCNNSDINITGYTNGTDRLYIYCNESDTDNAIHIFDGYGETDLQPETEWWDYCFWNELGIYNITLIDVGNDIYAPSSQTQWVNLTYCPEEPAANFTAGYVICIDNSTLFHNNSFVYEIGDERTWYENCPYGCSNETFSCKLEPMTQGFYAFGFVIAFILIIVFFDKVVLKR